MDLLDYHLQKNSDYLHFWYRARKEMIFSWLSSFYFSGAKLKIADLGCGCGEELDELKRFGDVAGVEVNFEAAELARKKGVEVVVGDLAEIDLGKDVYDVVVAFDCLEHIKDDRLVLSKAYAALKDGGRIFLTVPAYPFLFGPHDRAMGHWRRYRDKEIAEKLGAVGFSEIVVGHWNVLLFFPIVFWRFLKKVFSQKNSARQDYRLPSRPINWLFYKIMSLENIIGGPLRRLPGVSITVSAKK